MKKAPDGALFSHLNQANLLQPIWLRGLDIGLKLVQDIVDAKIGSVDIESMSGPAGLSGFPEHLVIGNPISQLEDLLKISIVCKVK